MTNFGRMPTPYSPHEVVHEARRNNERSSFASFANPLRGHPPGVTILAFTEVWERMSYYGMRALLVYYMTKQLAFSQSHSSMIYGLYTAAVWLAPLPGGAIADRYLGQHKSVLIGGSLMALGHFMMAFASLFYVALGAIAVGNGLFKPNISTQIGDLYAQDDPRRDRGYSIYYVGANFGAFIAPPICGTIGEIYGWHWGFGVAGVGMLVALGTYQLGRRWLPPDRLDRQAARVVPLDGAPDMALKKIAALGAISFCAAFFWMVFEQQGNTIALWADTFTNRHIAIGSIAFTIPATWFQSLNGLFIISVTPCIIAIWRSQAKRHKEPSSANKLAIGAAIGGGAYLIMILAAYVESKSGPVSWLWLIAYFLAITVGELYLSPTCLSLFNKAAPSRLASTMVGVWYLSLFLGSYLAGVAGSFWDDVAKPTYFAAMAGFAFISALALLLTGRTLSKALAPRAGGIPSGVNPL
jgi:proton-dependent oligopeptide transporter, POT family